MSKIFVDQVDPKTATTLTLGTTGDTVDIPTGVGLSVTDEVKTNKISPATGTAFALGDSGDTFTVPSGATIVNSGTATGFGGGKVLQVVSASVGNVTTTTTSFADTGLTVDITPAATSSKILALVNMVGIYKGAQLSSINMVLVRDSTDILEFAAIAGYTADTGESSVGGTGCAYLDSPSTTSATTYKVQWALAAGTSPYQIGAWYSGSIRPLSTITVMEIGA